MTGPVTAPATAGPAPWVRLAERAVGWRQGPVAVLRRTPTGRADVDLPSWAAQPNPFTDGDTAGGAAATDEQARAAAIAELLERSAAARCRLEDCTDGAADGRPRWELGEFSLHDATQQAAGDFPHPGYRDPVYAAANTLPGGEPVWVPAGLVALRSAYGLPATSSGLAADPSAVRALLRATQELVERDAFTVAWLHGIAAKRVAAPAELLDGVAERGGEVHVLDLTPAHSPHPVAAVIGTLPVSGRPRPTLGLACRASWSTAVHKAWHEWVQGTVYVALRTNGGRHTPSWTPAEVTDFHRHALYYAGAAAHWAQLPIHGSRPAGPLATTPADSPASDTGDAAELLELTTALARAGIRLAHRDLTGPEAAAVGLRVVRVLSPELVPLHGDHNWPFLGGTARDLRRRFPEARAAVPFPSPHPHPLG